MSFIHETLIQTCSLKTADADVKTKHEMSSNSIGPNLLSTSFHTLDCGWEWKIVPQSLQEDGWKGFRIPKKDDH